MSMVAFITGAARGIGAETARRLARDGIQVALVGLEPDELAKVSADCPGSIWIEADVTDAEAMKAAVDRTVTELGGIDIVMANAGIGAGGFMAHMDEAVAQRVFDVNLMGVWRTVRYCLPHVVERRGYVLSVASLAAIAHSAAAGVYSATKAGVEAFTESLRCEVKHLGVDVGVAYFSWIDTEMVRGMDRSDIWGPMRAGAPGPFGKTLDVGSAADAVVKGIHARQRMIVAPGWVRFASMARRPLQWLTERDAPTRVPEHYARAEAAVATRGAESVTGPVGAGGEADRQASSARSSNHTLVEPS
jgi:NAD(P)-dependent dehydrogenase (short-subunit alcohol dehydrogenase family)